MKALFLHDLYYIRSNSAVMSFLLIILMLADASGGIWGLTAMWFGMFSYTIYASSERQGWLKYCDTLPIERQEVVAEKYLFSLAGGAVLTTVGVILRIAAALIFGRETDILIIAAYICGSLSLTLIYPAILLPLSIKFGSHLAWLGTVVIIPLMMAEVLLSTFLTVSPDQPIFRSKIVLVTFIIFAVCAALFAGSYFLSVVLYKRKEM